MKNIIRKRLMFSMLITVISIAFLAAGCSKNQNSEVKNTDSSKKSSSQEAKVNTPEKNPVATIEMSDGSKIKVELYPAVAPNTVKNFIYLTKNGFYNGLIFHRVIPDFMIQGGDPNGNGTGGADYTIKGEFSDNGVKNDLKHVRGVISMARSSSSNSASSQFFIMVADAPSLDGQYAAFGKVTEGMEVADKIVGVKRNSNDKPLVEQKIKSITVDTFGVNYGEPEKIK